MVKPRNITGGLLTQVIRAVERPSSRVADDKIQVTDLEYIGSYNWVNSQSPKIIVPGSPPRWMDRTLPYKVPHDRGRVVRERMPSMSLFPLLRAVDCSPKTDGISGVDWPSVDFVSDRRNFRKLLRWVSGSGEQFRIDVQLGGKRTVLFNRWHDRQIMQAEHSSFGHNFERASTIPAEGCECSVEHNRIIKYDLGGLKMVVRFEVDAYVDPVSPESPSKIQPEGHPTPSEPMGPASSQIHGAPEVQLATPGKDGLDIIRGGYYVPQSSIVELKTEKKGKKFNAWSLHYPQLFFAQTQHIFKAIHIDGNFEGVNKATFENSLLVKGSMAVRLLKFISVMKVIQDVVTEGGDHGRLSLVCRDGRLEVFERLDRSSCLPEAALARFKRHHDNV